LEICGFARADQVVTLRAAPAVKPISPSLRRISLVWLSEVMKAVLCLNCTVNYKLNHKLLEACEAIAKLLSS
jgi:hypothetical protein